MQNRNYIREMYEQFQIHSRLNIHHLILKFDLVLEKSSSAFTTACASIACHIKYYTYVMYKITFTQFI